MFVHLSQNRFAPPTTPEPKLGYNVLQSANKVRLKFLAGWGFTAMDSLVANPFGYLQFGGHKG